LELVRQCLEEIAESQQSTSMKDDKILEADEEPMDAQQGTVDDTIEEYDQEEEEVSTGSAEEIAEEAGAGAMTTRSERVVNKPERLERSRSGKGSKRGDQNVVPRFGGVESCEACFDKSRNDGPKITHVCSH
jgi:hypothetical protein